VSAIQFNTYYLLIGRVKLTGAFRS